MNWITSGEESDTPSKAGGLISVAAPRADDLSKVVSWLLELAYLIHFILFNNSIAHAFFPKSNF